MCVRVFFFFQAEDGIRDLVRSRGLGDVYKRQALHSALVAADLPHLESALPALTADGAWPSAALALSLIHI